MSASVHVRPLRPGKPGPHPEPLTSERCARILSHAAERLAERAATAPAGARGCPVERALGRTIPCRGRACIYYRVPGVDGSCAIATWTGPGGPDRRLAAWFAARRREAERRRTTSAINDEKSKEGR